MATAVHSPPPPTEASSQPTTRPKTTTSSSQPLPPPPTTTPSAPTRRRIRYSLFPPIPAPLQRLFDLVPLWTYAPNALPSDPSDTTVASGAAAAASADSELPTLFVFLDPADAVRGRPSFNPTCLKWQTFLRFSGTPVRLASSSNHASPTGALPFLLPPRSSSSASPPLPIPSHKLSKYVARQKQQQKEQKEQPNEDQDQDPRVPAYQALLDSSLRRAWLHAVYLVDDDRFGPLAGRLYAHPSSTVPVVRSLLTQQLRAAAAAEIGGPPVLGSAAGVAKLYADAAEALTALESLLQSSLEAQQPETETKEELYFFGAAEPSLFDAAVFSYTHLLLEDGDDEQNGHGDVRFVWPDRTLPDLVRQHPSLVRHRNRILQRYWPATQSEQPNGVADSVTWVKI